MKKALVILLILSYATSTFGMEVKESFCCGKLKSVSVSLLSEAKEKSAKKDDGCCQTKYHLSKVKDNHLLAQAIAFAIKHFDHGVIDLIPFSTLTFFHTRATIPTIIYSPPVLPRSIPIYIFICVFRV